MAGFVLLHVMILGAASKPDLLMMLAATLVGLVLDNALGALGLVTYVGSVTMGYAPLWLVMIWAGFGVTLRHSQSIFIRSRSHALLLGALCGPLAYWGGVKLERMTIGGTNAWIAIAVFWAVALTALHEVPKRWAAAS